MGEGWSDWYALDNQRRVGLETDEIGTPGEIDVGEYSDRDPHAPRTQAAGLPGRRRRRGAAPAASAPAPGGYTLRRFGKIAGGPEVHADGEIWSETLWDLRQALQVAGSAGDASDIAEILITDGMRVSPPEPSFLDMRNAILTADERRLRRRASTTSSGRCSRKRGMGYFAGCGRRRRRHPDRGLLAAAGPERPDGHGHRRVIDADTGLPVAGVFVEFGGQRRGRSSTSSSATRRRERALHDRGRPGRAPTRSSPSRRRGLRSGDRAQRRRSTQDATAVRNAAMLRDWSSDQRRAMITQVSDDTGATAAAARGRRSTSRRAPTWSAVQPDERGSGQPARRAADDDDRTAGDDQHREVPDQPDRGLRRRRLGIDAASSGSRRPLTAPRSRRRSTASGPATSSPTPTKARSTTSCRPARRRT